MLNDTESPPIDFDPDSARMTLEDALADGGDGLAMVDELAAKGYDRRRLVRILASIPDPKGRSRYTIANIIVLLLLIVNVLVTFRMVSSHSYLHSEYNPAWYPWVCLAASLVIGVEVIRMRPWIFRVGAICCLGFAVVDWAMAMDGGLLIFPMMVIAAMILYYVGFNLFPYYTITGPRESHHGRIDGRPAMTALFIIGYLVVEVVFGIFPVSFFRSLSAGQKLALQALVLLPPVLMIAAAIFRKRIAGSPFRNVIMIMGWIWLAVLAWIAFAGTPWHWEPDTSWGGGHESRQALKPVISYSFGYFLMISCLMGITSKREEPSFKAFAREHGPFLLYLLLIWLAGMMPPLPYDHG